MSGRFTPRLGRSGGTALAVAPVRPAGVPGRISPTEAWAEHPRRTAWQPQSKPRPAPFDPDHFVLTLWTNEPDLARRADEAGVDRIGLDLETYGKAERQPKQLATWISPHREDQLPALRTVLNRGKLFCRINPINPDSKAEIERLLVHGVQVMMLPMFTTADEVARFVDFVDGRAECVLLLENKTAADRVEEVVAVRGIDEVHVGLNDLTLSIAGPNRNRFAVLASDLMLRLSDAVASAGIRFGVGGIGRPMDAGQRVPSDLIYAQYPRLGATAALMARSFLGAEPQTLNLAAEVAATRARMAWWKAQPPAQWELAKDRFVQKVEGEGW